MLVGVGNAPADPAQPQGGGRLKHHDSLSEVTLLLNLHINLSSMAQSKTDITFGNLGRGFQVGINSGPIHVPPGTSQPAGQARLKLTRPPVRATGNSTKSIIYSPLLP
jgi:hypothetical protein